MEAASNGDGSGGPGPTEEKAASPAQKEPFQVRKKDQMQLFLYRDGIIGHEFDKRLELFAPCYSESPLLADLYRKPYFTLVLKLHTKKSAKQENSSLS